MRSVVHCCQASLALRSKASSCCSSSRRPSRCLSNASASASRSAARSAIFSGDWLIIFISSWICETFSLFFFISSFTEALSSADRLPACFAASADALTLAIFCITACSSASSSDFLSFTSLEVTVLSRWPSFSLRFASASRRVIQAFTDSMDASASAKAFLASCSSSSCALSLAPVSSKAARASRYLSTRVSSAAISCSKAASAPRSPTSFLLLFRVFSRVSRARATPLASDIAETSWLRPSRSRSLDLRNCSKLTSSGEATRSAESSLMATSSSRWSSKPTPSCSSSCFLQAARAELIDSSAAALGPSPEDSTHEASSDTQ
mmetsp:Transcript_28776/g.63444  ORF Transcript_28776/g.63444 Transcript_28776/m.63444 type:complete len:322 (-) Transcript_28776:796-1761(-)